jgi:O-methyltransferase
MKSKIMYFIQHLLYQKGCLLTRTIVNLGRERKISMYANGSGDYCRTSTLELCAHEINSRMIKGSIAEVGVYQGLFASKLSQLFPDRTLYLFDTFEGFDKRDFLESDSEFFNTNKNKFKDSSLEQVVKKINSNYLEIRCGYFPDTLKEYDYEQEFAFVSLDADLFKPIYDGLCFFYPRLARMGYIFVHDYNNMTYPGCKEAVNKFMKENDDVTIVPLSDGWGTVVITK